MEYIQVTEKNKDSILGLFRKAVDTEGYIIDTKNKKRLVCAHTKKNIPANDFSILPGSAVFVNNSYYAFAKQKVKNNA